MMLSRPVTGGSLSSGFSTCGLTLCGLMLGGLTLCASLPVYGQVASPTPQPRQPQPQAQAQVTPGVTAAAQPSPKNGQKNGQTKVVKKAATSAKVAPTPAPTPVPSPTPMQAMKPSDMPPVPPQVSFKNGLLTVNAVNSTLGSLLAVIRNKTGIEFEGAELAGSDRVAISMGPATEGEVLASILSGSSLDYVVMGRPDSPNIVQRVLLSRRSHPGAATVANGQPAPNATGQQEGDEDAPDENAIDPDQPQDTAAQPPPVQQQPPVQQPPEGQAQPQQPPADQAGQPKTPEQLLQELKEMQQRQSGQTPDPNSAPRKIPPQPM